VRRIAWGLVALVTLAAVALPPAAPTAAAAGGRSFTITAGGDILIHRTIAQIADANAPGAGVYDFTPMLLPIEPWVGEADLAICHLEGALDPANTGLSYYPLFNAPHEVADALAAVGYDACSTAGNHTLDHGFTGVADTLAVLDAAGIHHAGSARSPEESLPSLYEVNGVTVGHLSYTYGTNGLPLPEDKPWAVNLIGDGDGILEDARWARQHGAEFVVVSMHWGTEYQTAPTAEQVRLAERLLSSPDIDLILGCHVHVVQPIGRVNG
jgi:poly-gamma-glutamate capsule biosynthesis protein CapA/YwtB (metallophosphatase superfamily)